MISFRPCRVKTGVLERGGVMEMFETNTPILQHFNTPFLFLPLPF